MKNNPSFKGIHVVPTPLGVCLKVPLENGSEISISFDDSCGNLKGYLARPELIVFDKFDRETEVITNPSPEDLAEMIQKHSTLKF